MVKKSVFKLCPKFLFLIFRKSQEVSFHYVHSFKSIRRSKIRIGLKQSKEALNSNRAVGSLTSSEVKSV